MYFENEKDNINIDQNLEEDLIVWGDDASSGDDGIISIKNEKLSSDTSSSSPYDDLNFVDEPAISNGASDFETTGIADIDSDTDEIDEEELKRILGGDTGSEVEYVDTGDFDTEPQAIEQHKEEIENTEITDDEILPRKEEVKKQSSTSPVLIAILVGIIVVAVLFLVYSFVLNKDEDDDSQVNPVINQEQLPSSDEQQAGENTEQAIPVVNEEEVSELKPEEEEKEEEEKKEVVNVIPTGRTDPFVPLPKYIVKAPDSSIFPVVTKTINNIDYDSISIPKPPQQYGSLSEITTKLMSISVSGIMYDPQKPSAIITYEGNDYFVQNGDKLNNFKVVEIGPNYVKIALGKNVYKANVGEEFKIVSDFYGNNIYKGNNRQYYSSEEEFTNRVENSKKYTSESDVQIYTK